MARKSNNSHVDSRPSYLTLFKMGPLPEKLRVDQEQRNLMEDVVFERNSRYNAAVERGKAAAAWITASR